MSFQEKKIYEDEIILKTKTSKKLVQQTGKIGSYRQNHITKLKLFPRILQAIYLSINIHQHALEGFLIYSL